MPLTNHTLHPLRAIFAACAAATHSCLSLTQRAAIILALADPQWGPCLVEIPDTWAVVAAWYTAAQRQYHTAVQAILEEDKRCSTP